MIRPCHKTMLNRPSQNSSRQWARGTANGTFSATSTKASTGKPIDEEIARNVNAGKSCTPIFMIGQLMPQTMVRTTRTIH